MKKTLLLVALLAGNALIAISQDLKSKDVPSVVKEAFAKKYQTTLKVSWEKEKENFEANWGGKSGEDNSAVFTPGGEFVEIVNAMPVKNLPPAVFTYVKAHYNGTKINEAGKVTDAAVKRCLKQR